MAQKEKIVWPPEVVLWALNACLQEKVMCWKQTVSTKTTRLKNACDVLLADGYFEENFTAAEVCQWKPLLKNLNVAALGALLDNKISSFKNKLGRPDQRPVSGYGGGIPGQIDDCLSQIYKDGLDHNEEVDVNTEQKTKFSNISNHF